MWLDTLTQSASTFVAIIAALYTTKVLSIVSEKQGIRRQIEIFESELEERKNILKRYVDEIEGIMYDDADEKISRFLKELIRTVDLGVTPTVEELTRVFNEQYNREINEYELKVLEVYYERFIETYERKKEEKRKREEMKAKHRAFGIPDLSYMTGMLSDMSYLVDALKPEYLYERELRNFDELIKQRDKENDQIVVLERILMEYQKQKESLAYPRYMVYGYLALIYFSIVSVVVPLLVPIFLGEVSLQALQYLSLLFISGLLAVFRYLQLELGG